MTPRERIVKAIHHQETDWLPVDIGATSATGINASALYRLTAYLGLPAKPPIINDTMQMLSQLDNELRSLLQTDVVPLPSPSTKIGTKITGKYQPFIMPGNTPALLDETVKYTKDSEGNYYLYPQGDLSAPYSMKMTSDGSFFNCLDRIMSDEDSLTPREDFSDFNPAWSDDIARHYEQKSHELFEETDYAIACAFGQGGFGDLAKVPGPTVRRPRGIRTVESFIMAHYLRPDYLHEVFSMQCDAALKNLNILRQAVGDRIQLICMGGTDFGAQNGPYYAPEIYRELYKPYIRRLNDYVHGHTKWKTFWHSCGSIAGLLDDFIDAGVDITNPVQCSAAGMDPEHLKNTYGDRIVFWGGGVDTQHTLPFGTPTEVREQARLRIELFKPGGGFVFSSVHNIVAGVPPQNLAALLAEVKRHRQG